MTLTLLIAIYGDLTGTASLAFTIFRYLALNSIRLSIFTLGNMQKVEDSRKYLQVSVVNTGNKPITISSISYAVYVDGKQTNNLSDADKINGLHSAIDSTGQFPYKLETSDRCEGLFDQEQIQNFNALVDNNSLFVYVDTTESLFFRPNRLSNKVKRLYSSS